ncbi:MAG: hypothetical protein V8R01_01845 [Bacilli bacterium]
MLKLSKNQEKELYQEYDNFIVYNIFSIDNNGNRKFLYRTTEHKMKTKYHGDENDA